MSDERWIKVWCQGGPVGDWHYFTLIEPPEVIHVMRDPLRPDFFIRVFDAWPESAAYRRVPAVEQLDDERIYYPVP
jgi:hypothetical protein